MRYTIPSTAVIKLLIYSSITLATFNANAKQVVETAQFTKCMNDVDLGAFKNTQWGACYEAELARQNKRLEQEYKKLLADPVNISV